VGSSDAPRKLAALYEAHGEKIRYLAVGGWNTAFGYGLFLVLLAWLGAPIHSWSASSAPVLSLAGQNYYLVVQWLGWIVAVPQSTLTMKHFVFKREGSVFPQIGRAFLIYLPAQGLSSLVLWTTVRGLHLVPQVGALVAIVITTIFSYIGHKRFTFRIPLEAGKVSDEHVAHES